MPREASSAHRSAAAAVDSSDACDAYARRCRAVVEDVADVPVVVDDDARIAR